MSTGQAAYVIESSVNVNINPMVKGLAKAGQEAKKFDQSMANSFRGASAQAGRSAGQIINSFGSATQKISRYSSKMISNLTYGFKQIEKYAFYAAGAIAASVYSIEKFKGPVKDIENYFKNRGLKLNVKLDVEQVKREALEISKITVAAEKERRTRKFARDGGFGGDVGAAKEIIDSIKKGYIDLDKNGKSIATEQTGVIPGADNYMKKVVKFQSDFSANIGRLIQSEAFSNLTDKMTSMILRIQEVFTTPAMFAAIEKFANGISLLTNSKGFSDFLKLIADGITYLTNKFSEWVSKDPEKAFGQIKLFVEGLIALFVASKVFGTIAAIIKDAQGATVLVKTLGEFFGALKGFFGFVKGNAAEAILAEEVVRRAVVKPLIAKRVAANAAKRLAAEAEGKIVSRGFSTGGGTTGMTLNPAAIEPYRTAQDAANKAEMAATKMEAVKESKYFPSFAKWLEKAKFQLARPFVWFGQKSVGIFTSIKDAIETAMKFDLAPAWKAIKNFGDEFMKGFRWLIEPIEDAVERGLEWIGTKWNWMKVIGASIAEKFGWFLEEFFGKTIGKMLSFLGRFVGKIASKFAGPVGTVLLGKDLAELARWASPETSKAVGNKLYDAGTMIGLPTQSNIDERQARKSNEMLDKILKDNQQKAAQEQYTTEGVKKQALEIFSDDTKSTLDESLSTQKAMLLLQKNQSNAQNFNFRAIPKQRTMLVPQY